MRKKEQARGSAAEKRDERTQIEPPDARERRHARRRVMSCGIADLDAQPGGIAPGADIRQVGRAPAAEFAEAMAVAAAFAQEYLPASTRAGAGGDDGAGNQADAHLPFHGNRLYAGARRWERGD